MGVVERRTGRQAKRPPRWPRRFAVRNDAAVAKGALQVGVSDPQRAIAVDDHAVARTRHQGIVPLFGVQDDQVATADSEVTIF
jgi:hypothetical protein